MPSAIMNRILSVAAGAVMLVASSAKAQTRRPTPSFEVASIKQDDSGQRGASLNSAMPDGFAATNASLKMLVALAYGLNDVQVSGGPSWVSSERYDILAKASGKVTDEERMLMLQSLLADRFKLRVHAETKEGRALALMVAKNGPKLRTDSPPGLNSIRARRGLIFGENVSMGVLAGKLTDLLGHAVLDETGLTGIYHIELRWTPDEISTPTQPGPDALPQSSVPDASGPSLSAALQEQLGLKLGVAVGTVKMLLIDGAEKASAN
jgi:uncharacterized protein (TIGR03435 family)